LHCIFFCLRMQR